MAKNVHVNTTIKNTNVIVMKTRNIKIANVKTKRKINKNKKRSKLTSFFI